MPVLSRQLYQRFEGADEDRWRLLFDTDANRFFVEHEWKRGDPRGRGYSADTNELEVDDFLKERDEGEAQRELVRLLAGLF